MTGLGSLSVRSPFPAHAYFQLYDWSLPVWKLIASDDTPKDREGFVEFEIGITDDSSVKTWGIWRGDELGGFVSAIRFPQRRWIAQLHCVFKKSFRGDATTGAAGKQICQELFDDKVLKIEMWVFSDNHAIKGLISRLGGRVEGTLSAQVMRDGKPIDMVVYGLYRESLKME